MRMLSDAAILEALSESQALACTMLGEARGDAAQGWSSVEERIAVGCVIRNRTRTPRRWGDTLKASCLQRLQFSCWNASDPNRAVLLGIAYRLVTGQPVMDALVDETGYLAAGIVSGVILDQTLGADHYVTAALYKSTRRPAWVARLAFTRQIGAHVFFRTPVRMVP